MTTKAKPRVGACLCPKCGAEREPSGMENWARCKICFPPKTWAEGAPFVPKEIGRAYSVPPNVAPWNDQEFRGAIRGAVIRARCSALKMGVVIKGRFGLCAAQDPSSVKPKDGIAIVGMQPNRTFVVYLCSKTAEQFQVPEEWYGR